MIFCGVNYSFEQQYQAIRRCYRFGQTKPVQVHYVTCTSQEKVMSAVEFKAKAAMSMIDEMRIKK
jgi:SNF2 family DNA or RNA helicase